MDLGNLFIYSQTFLREHWIDTLKHKRLRFWWILISWREVITDTQKSACAGAWIQTWVPGRRKWFKGLGVPVSISSVQSAGCLVFSPNQETWKGDEWDISVQGFSLKHRITTMGRCLSEAERKIGQSGQQWTLLKTPRDLLREPYP